MKRFPKINLLWIVPLYSYLGIKIVQTLGAYLNDLVNLFRYLGPGVLISPSFYVWNFVTYLTFIFPIAGMALFIKVLKADDLTTKKKVYTILGYLAALLAINFLAGLIYSCSYPSFIDSHGLGRMRMIPCLPTP